MLEASFDRGRDRSAAVSGAYQYDTGQRLRMHGLPSPQELAGEDDFLSGGMITVQVHFSLKGDSQTQARLALWDEETRCYLAAVPDEYMQTSESVQAYVYVSYGTDEGGNSRAKTMYELIMRPIARPAPNNVATEEQWEAWAVKQSEMTLSIDALRAAEQSAQAAAQSTMQAADTAKQAAQQAIGADGAAQEETAQLKKTEDRWRQMTLQVTRLAPGAQATAALQGGVLTLGIASGAAGEKGQTGDTGPADIALSLSNGVLTITPRT